MTTAIDDVPDAQAIAAEIGPGAGAPATVALAPWIAAHRPRIEDRLAAQGAVLFRGFAVDEVADFAAACRAFSGELVEYVGGGSPRTRIADAVYTSTEYAAAEHILVHSEASYLRKMPSLIWFYCHTPPAERGATPLADLGRILARLDPAIVERFDRRGLRYVGNLHGGSGFGKSWQATYLSDDRAEVERRIAERGIEHEWRPDGTLRTFMPAPGLRAHPRSGAPIWGNQAANWHWATLAPHIVTSLRRLYGDSGNFPKAVFHGDGGEIEPDDIRAIAAVLKAEERAFAWARGDVLLVDNHRIAHGRQPFSGPRKIFVAMA